MCHFMVFIGSIFFWIFKSGLTVLALLSWCLPSPSLFFMIIAASALEIFSVFFHLVLRFWNQILTCCRHVGDVLGCSWWRVQYSEVIKHLDIAHMSACCWVTRRLLAISALSAEERYFLLSKLFSSSKICLPVKVVLIFFFALPSADAQSRMSSTSESFLRLFFFPISFVAPNSLVIIWFYQFDIYLNHLHNLYIISTHL